MRTGTAARAALVVAVAALAGCGDGGRGGADTAGSAAPPSATEWALPNADLRNTRRVAGPIDAASVSRLRRAWRVPAGPTASTAVVVGGVVYAQDLQSNVSARRLSSGRALWRRHYREEDIGPNGVTVADGRVYGATEVKAFALDAKSGKQLWTRKLPANDHEGIDMAPGYHDGTVYVSTVPTNLKAFYGPGGRGILWAIDGASGRVKWKWAQVPARLWGRPDVNGGGGLWHPPAFDGHGSLYVAIGNPSPWPGVQGAPWATSRPGPNRWTNSIVKLDERSGKLLWGRQVVPHDLYDWDLEGPVILTRVHGREVALTAGKMGFVYAFDADDGALLWKRSVGLHNGHDHDGLKAMHGGISRMPTPVQVLPGQLGGVETQMAIDDDTVYVPVENLASTYGAFGEAGSNQLSTGRGEIVALEIATGRVRWSHRLPHNAFSAATVVNDLVFTATYDGTVWALRARTGKLAWKAKLPAGTNAPVTVAGSTLIAAAGVPQRRGDRSALVAYRLAP